MAKTMIAEIYRPLNLNEATEWEQFRALDLERLRDLMACPVIVDLRNVYRPEEMHRYGFA
jgi:UDP-glucose 6-dehydrogenase